MCKGFIKRENTIGKRKGAGEGEGGQQSQGRSDPRVKDRGREGWATESKTAISSAGSARALRSL